MRSVCPINQNWLFLKDTKDAPVSLPTGGERVDLPHTWNALDGQDGGNDYFRGSCCYVKSLSRRELPAGEVYYLEINGANSSAEVYLNGRRLAHHDGGYSTFRVNLTGSLREENLLAVLVDNSPNGEVYPQMADFTFYGGLYRSVNIIAVSAVHFALEPYGTPGIHVTPRIDGNTATVRIQTEIEGLTNGDTVRFELLDAEGKAVCAENASLPVTELALKEVHRWDGIKDPYLYTAKATILRGGKEKDAVSTRFGCHSFAVNPEHGFLLNGREYPLHGVSRHQDRKDIGNALLPEHHREDMALIREMGANTIRLAHYQHDAYFYELCDEYGMIVWAEIPYISAHMPCANENAESQMRELITQCRNHPSIVVWGLSNEITMEGAGDPDMLRQHKRLNELVHRMDPTRPTVIACLSICAPEEEYVHIPDVVSYNHYFGWYGGSFDEYGPWFDRFHKKYPNIPIGVSEYGCEALNWHSSDPRAGDYSEEYQALYHEALIKQLFSRHYLWATHVWNMFDFGADARCEGGENGQNHKGLVTFDRRYKKDAFYAYKAWLSDEPFVHICGKRYVDRTEPVTKVRVYSNQPEVELLANQKSLGKARAEDHFFVFEVPNAGETRLEAVAGNCRDEALLRKVDSANESYILRETGTVLNWFDITAPEGRFSLHDKIEEIAATPRGRLWLFRLLLMISKKQGRADGKERKGKDAFGGALMRMIGSFSVLRFTGMLAMRNISFTKEELLRLNRGLNRIKKPKQK